jgi:hypothetical protein
VSGDVRRSNQSADAQQYPPAGAGSAPRTGGEKTEGRATEGRATGDGTIENGAGPEIRWVGEQWRMQGYCGRATLTGPSAAADDGRRQSEAPAPRAVVLLQRQGRPVVRIGPRPPPQDDESPARAA